MPSNADPTDASNPRTTDPGASTSLRTELLREFDREVSSLDEVVATIPDVRWTTLSAAPGWTIAAQIGHLTWLYEAMACSIDSPAEFIKVQQLVAEEPEEVDRAALHFASVEPKDLREVWLSNQARLAARLGGADRARRLDWFGPLMSINTAVSAMVMETWAHGLDIRDALGLPPSASNRLRTVARLAFVARDFSFRNRGLVPPDRDFYLELTSPDREVWAWGDPASDQRISASAVDFALLAVRRRTRADLDIIATGDAASKWLDVIQAFAGPPGADPLPLGA